RLYYPRGKVVGGSSTICGMIHTRGAPHDYDGWAGPQGCAGWDFASVVPLFKRSEDYLHGDSHYRGRGGMLPVTRNPSPSPTSVAFVEAAQQYGLPYVEDYNAGRICGASYSQFTVHNGRRMNAWESFCAPIADNPRFVLKVSVLVIGLIFDADACVGIKYLDGGYEHTAYAEREVIVCAGVINSPQLLLLSG